MRHRILPLGLLTLAGVAIGCSETTPVKPPATNQQSATAPTPTPGKKTPVKGGAPKLGTTDASKF